MRHTVFITIPGTSVMHGIKSLLCIVLGLCLTKLIDHGLHHTLNNLSLWCNHLLKVLDLLLGSTLAVIPLALV